jgi:hypothetical protein
MNNPPFLLGEKSCSICKQIKPIYEFGKRKAAKWRNENFNSQCKACERIRKAEDMRRWRSSNPERVKEIERNWRNNNPDRIRNMNLKKFYGIGLKQYDQMLISQNYECKICKCKHTPHTRETRLNVDHCHKNNKIRGLLCHQCNKGLGHFKDNIEFLNSAISYLREHS